MCEQTGRGCGRQVNEPREASWSAGDPAPLSVLLDRSASLDTTHSKTKRCQVSRTPGASAAMSVLCKFDELEASMRTLSSLAAEPREASWNAGDPAPLSSAILFLAR